MPLRTLALVRVGPIVAWLVLLYPLNTCLHLRPHAPGTVRVVSAVTSSGEVSAVSIPFSSPPSLHKATLFLAPDRTAHLRPLIFSTDVPSKPPFPLPSGRENRLAGCTCQALFLSVASTSLECPCGGIGAIKGLASQGPAQGMETGREGALCPGLFRL